MTGYLALSGLIGKLYCFAQRYIVITFTKKEMGNTFPIFERNTKPALVSTGMILFCLLLISSIISSQFKWFEQLFKTSTVILLIINFIYWSTQHKRYKVLDGTYRGQLIFNRNGVIVNDRSIELSEIKKIYLRANDYKGKETTSHGYETRLSTRMSNGTNNLLDLTLQSGEKIKCFFKMEFMQHEFLKPFIIALVNNNIISFEDSIEILQLEEDYKVNLFRIELNKKALD
jgi:hypothetical protein